MVSLKLVGLRKPELWGSVVKTSESKLSSKDMFWRSRKRARFSRSGGWVASTIWIGLVDGRVGGCRVRSDHAVSGLHSSPVVCCGRASHGVIVVQLSCCGVTESGLQGESGVLFSWSRVRLKAELFLKQQAIAVLCNRSFLWSGNINFCSTMCELYEFPASTLDLVSAPTSDSRQGQR